MKENFAYLKEVLGVKYLPQERVTKGKARGAKLQSPVSLESLEKKIAGCIRCKLSEGRTNIVFGEGSPKAQLMFVGEAPGHDEDLQAKPFVGRSGQLLTKMINAMGLGREDVYIANVAKCRPPNNRNPQEDEIAACSPFLRAQIELINPKIIVALGKFAAQTLLQTETRITDLRGKVHTYHGRDFIATYHPAYLLRNPGQKKEVWKDLQVVMKKLGLKPVSN